MKNLYYYLLAFIILMLCSCEDKKQGPISGSLGKPGKVEILGLEAIAGGVIVTYKIPDTEDILSVKAKYDLSRGASESVASYYENTLTIRGYDNMTEQEAKIYVINRAQVESDPVSIKFTPLEASFRKVAKSMEIMSDFGGARFSWENIDQEPLIFEFFAADSLGRMQAMRVINSSVDEMKYSLRGYKPEPRRFAAVIRDRWENACDTLNPPVMIVPLLEERLNKKIMSVMQLSNDQNFANWEGMNHYIIDDDKGTFGHSPNSSLPAPFTIDLGVKAKLSRFLFFNRNFNNSYYSWGNPKTFEVYVCFSTPSNDGNWDDWTKVLECEQIKPSGSPGTTMTDEDVNFAEAGFEFEFDLTMEPVRYVRFVVKSTWENTSFCHPCELDFFGVTVE